MELRLMTDASYLEEFDILVNRLTDEYVNDELSNEDRLRAEKYFFAAKDRKKKLGFARALKAEKLRRAQGHSRRSGLKLALPIAATVILALGLAAVFWPTFFSRSQTSEALLALQNAFRNQRPVESRISALNYAPYSDTRGPGDKVTDPDELRRSELALLTELKKRDTSSVRHALGQVYLAKREFDTAITEFENALRSDPQNPQLYSDLGAAWLEKGKLRDAAEPGKPQEDFGRSLENLNRSLELNPNLLEALFNRALCYERFGIPAKAEQDWQTYLTKDATSPWAEEAKRHLKNLQEQKARRTVNERQLLENFQTAFKNNSVDDAWQALKLARSRAGSSLVNSLVDEYLSLLVNGSNREADEKLQMLSYAAKLEHTKTGDRFTTDLVRFYQSANPTQLASARKARSLVRTGSAHYGAGEFDKAVQPYSEAADNFRAAGDNGEELLAESSVGYSELRLLTAQKSVESFERLIDEFEARKYLSLVAQALQALAEAKTNLNERSQSVELANRAFKAAERIEDAPTMIRSLSSLLVTHLSFGDYQVCLDLFTRVIRLAEAMPRDPRLIWPAYYEVGLVFHNLDLPAAALAIGEEALGIANEANVALLRSRSLERLALLYSHQKRYEEAIQTGERALAEADQIASKRANTSLRAHAMLRLGRYNLEAGHTQKASSYFDQSLDLYRELKSDLYLYEAHKGKLMASLQLNDNEAADAEVPTVLALFEENRQKIFEESNRDKFFDAGQNTYDIAIDFAYTRKNKIEEALDYVERSRARSLLQLLSSGAEAVHNSQKVELKIGFETQPLNPLEIQKRLPANVQLLVYAVLKEKILMFVISRTSINGNHTTITEVELKEQINSYLDAIRARSDQAMIQQQAKNLYKKLISPIERYLNPHAILAIVADNSLNYLPFPSLISETTNHYFIEDYTIQLAPSATVFIHASEAAKARSSGSETLLSVGNPAFDSAELDSLPDLPDAAREAQEIGSFYTAKTTLIREAATPSKVKQLLPGAHVIHFATHAVADEQSPLRSRLILAPEKAQEQNSNHANSVLLAFDIYRTKLPRAHLVVLSACRTAIERHYRGEGAIGLARPFIAAGVPLVVASLWPVDSRSTAGLMVSFHRYRRNLSTVEALKRAQLDAIRNSQSDPQRSYDWAAFTAIGGYATF